MTRPIEPLAAREVLALAVNVERANARRFRAFADAFAGYDADGHAGWLEDKLKTLPPLGDAR